MPEVVCSRTVVGNKDEVYKIAANMEAYPNYMENVISVNIIEQGEDWTLTTWVTEIDGRTMSWIERDTFEPEKYTINYQQVKGDLKQFEGQWIIAEQDDKVDIQLTVNFDLGIPMLSTVLNPILKKKVADNCYAMLDGIKSQIESKAQFA